MSTIQRITEALVSEIGPQTFICDANALGFPADGIPDTLETELGDGSPLRYVDIDDDGAAVFRQSHGVVTVCVLNVRLPTVAEYFQQQLAVTLELGLQLAPVRLEEDKDRAHPNSPAHPDFHIATGCGEDGARVIRFAAVLLAYVRAGHHCRQRSVIDAAAILRAFLYGAFRDADLMAKADRLIDFVHGDVEADADEVAVDICVIAAEIVRCYVYG